MKILQINKFHWVKGGSERYCFDLADELSARGHDVAFFASHHPENRPTEWSKYFAPAADYHRAGPLESIRFAREVVYNVAAAANLERLIEAFRPDVAHLHNIHHQLSPSILAPLADAGVPVVQTLHDYKWVCPAYLFLSGGEVCEECGPGNRFAPVLRKACHHGSWLKSLVVYRESSTSWKRRDHEKVARFLAPSRFMKERMVAHGLPAERVVEWPYFIREQEYRPAVEPGGDFLYLGRLSKEKGVTTLLEAMKRCSGLELRIAGSGPLEAELRERALRDNAAVRFLGHLSGGDLHDAIRAARAVVVPSEWYENQPFAILEAFALGVPVIGTSIGGIPELVADGETGRLVPPGNPEALAAALARTAADAQGAAAMGRAARARIERDFASAAAVARIEGLYAELSGR